MESTLATSAETGVVNTDADASVNDKAALKASRERKRKYVQDLERAIHVLTTEKIELQVKVATLTNQLWEQSLRIDELEKELAP